MRVARLLRCLPLALALTVAAHADPLDFRGNILDPPLPPNPSFPTFTIASSPFSVTFTQCQPSELPGNNTADGCFAGVNRSGSDWNSVSIVFSNAVLLGGQPVSCAPDPSNNVFSQTNCSVDPTDTYTLMFTGGLLTNGALFFITETGVTDLSEFPAGEATFTTTAATPEPASLLLLSTGLLGLAIVGKRHLS